VANRIHPTAVLGDGVEIGEDNVIGPYAVILGPTRIGDRNWIGPHACIGAPGEHRAHPQPAAWADDEGGEGVLIGDGNHLREHITVHQGTEVQTAIGSGCFVMVHSHVGHDAQVHDDATLAANALLAGHVVVGARATVGMGATVHQRTRIGPGAMIAMSAAVRRDVPPFSTAIGNPARVAGVNEVALRKLHCDDEAVAAVADMVKGGGRDVPADLPVPAEVMVLLRRWASQTPS
jgi:UDP-N-acetylglucosamine acyltransferase